MKMSPLNLSFMEFELLDLNNNSKKPASNNLVTQILEERASKTPERIAAKMCYDFSEQIESLKLKKIASNTYDELKNCCFKVNPYVCKLDDELLKYSLLADGRNDIDELKLLKTHCFNYVIINKNTLDLLRCFNGRNSILGIYEKYKNSNLLFFILNGDMAKHSWKVTSEKEELTLKNTNDFLLLIRLMYISKLIDLNSVNYGDTELKLNQVELFREEKNTAPKREIFTNRDKPKQQDKSILLLGSTPGSATIGILYIASYLKRNGISVYCKYNNLDVDYKSLKADLKKLISEIKPEIVGVSIKWFPHISRGLEICKIIKEISCNIEVVVGGNTSTIYNKEFIENDYVDYVVCGDGEVPLLKICKGEDSIPNCIYKKNGKIIKNSITYVQNDKNSNDIYLSHLEDILISKDLLYSVPYYYIYTGKGCLMNCCYCGGCLEAQKNQFNRQKPFLRNISEVRKDLIEVKKYASTFLFIDSIEMDTLNYHRELWKGIDLSNHFCHFYFYKIPPEEFISILAETFKYIYINVDLCSFSERHRGYLHSLNLVKPMPTDKELIEFVGNCNNYKNMEISVSLISGLPYYTNDDMKQSEAFLKRLMSYPVFKGAEWGRLHAQPGAPIVNSCKEYGMYSQAVEFDDFLKYSKLNMSEEIYPDVYSFKFPYINFNEEVVNDEVNKHYREMYALIKNKCQQVDDTVVYQAITYEEINIEAHKIADILKENGVGEDDVVCIIDEQSISLVIAVLGVLKVRGAYLLVNPDYSETEIRDIAKASNSKLILIGTGVRKRNGLGKINTIVYKI
ncbi:LOW QUALITY PROTEIN: AMP-dependent synthetase and ligase [Ruminiclostridium papyrosolvens DSM 2782]|uniref:AMP-dependent synthetase and ligase n=3 Tax=Ruminiclostridium papyrosolvens TaxID=29362 RepID=F1TDR8_9FIRM|nr:LOW QUALITY PROTEIN: AMP-dependent synthetase and ligase [Ruminiclostridium papyrosolvens DSM 2782]